MFRIHAVSFMILLVIGFVLGCSGNGQSSNPVTLQVTAGAEASGNSAPSQNLWGFWDVTINPSTGEAETVPLREATFQANVTQFLQPPASPINLLSIALDPGMSDFPSGYVVCNVTVRHPFPGLAKYRGFDVRGIAMGNGSISGVTGNGELYPALDDLRLLNADGYTRWWNSEEFTTYGTIFGYTQGKLAPPVKMNATVNGYKYYADDLGAEDGLDDLDLNMRGTFSPAHNANTRRYFLQFPVIGGSPVMNFNYAVTASYLDPINHDDPEYPLESYSPDSNQPEAFRIKITDAGSTAYFIDSSDFGGNLKLDIEIFDWDFAETSVIAYEISAITLESTTLFPSQIDVNPDDGVVGTSEYSYVFHVVIDDVTPTAVDNQEIFVRVLSTSPSDYAPDIPGITGFDYPDAPLAAYCLYEAEIGNISPSGNHPEVGEIDGPTSVLEGETATYTLSYATDPEDGTDLTILWDNDGDLDFNDDLDGDDTNLEAMLEFPTTGTFQVIARAVDSTDLYTDSDPYDVFVDYCPEAVHSDFQAKILGDAPSSYYWKMACAFFPGGDHKGELLIQRDNLDLRRYDVTQNSPWTGTPFITLASPCNSNDFTFELEICPFSGRVILATILGGLGPSNFQVYGPDGTYMSSIFVSGGNINAIDINDNGDLYIVTSSPGDPDFPATSYFHHFVYQETSPYYTEDITHLLECTAQLGHNDEVGDIAISYKLDRIYLLRGDCGTAYAPYGELHCWDICEDGALTLNSDIQNLHVFPNTVHGAFSFGYGNLVDMDIDIDHSYEASDECRIIVMAEAWSGGNYFGLFDADLNEVDMQLIPYQRRYAFTLREDADRTENYILTSGFSIQSVYMSSPPVGW